MSELINGWYCVKPEYYPETLPEEERAHNASKAMTFLRQHGFTIYSASAVVGNMWAESGMNPSQWEISHNTPMVYSGGYGLVQWTPYTNYSEWATETYPDEEWENNGNLEMERLYYERMNGLEFYPTQEYPNWRWNRFCSAEPLTSEGETTRDCINKLTEIFMLNYLRPGSSANLPNRRYHARWVYENAPGMGVPIWLLYKLKEKNRKGGRI